jgi:hypothetical protein
MLLYLVSFVSLLLSFLGRMAWRLARPDITLNVLNWLLGVWSRRSTKENIPREGFEIALGVGWLRISGLDGGQVAFHLSGGPSDAQGAHPMANNKLLPAVLFSFVFVVALDWWGRPDPQYLYTIVGLSVWLGGYRFDPREVPAGIAGLWTGTSWTLPSLGSMKNALAHGLS